MLGSALLCSALTLISSRVIWASPLVAHVDWMGHCRTGCTTAGSSGAPGERGERASRQAGRQAKPSGCIYIYIYI